MTDLKAPSAPSDEELARRAQAGSLPAFEELVSRYERRIYAFVLQCCRNGTDAREVAQETFVRAFRAIGRYNPRRGFAAWLFTIARRKCIDHHRAAPPAADEPMPELTDGEDPSELLARQEDRQVLWGLARRRLPEPQFQALWLRYAEDLNIADIAQVLGKTRVHVKVLLFRARQTLALEIARPVPSLSAGRFGLARGLNQPPRALPLQKAGFSPLL